jgi:hypothetical protein
MGIFILTPTILIDECLIEIVNKAITMFKKRIGPDPHADGECTTSLNGCPDIWELENGDFAVIGVRRTSELMSLLPETAGCGSDEEIVVIPRKTLLRGRNDIPDA